MSALAWSEPLTELHLSITWRRLQGLFEADGAYPFVDSGVQRHLELALAAARCAERRRRLKLRRALSPAGLRPTAAQATAVI